MGRIVIAAYRPRAGRQQALEVLMRRCHARLSAEGLVTDRQQVLMRSRDGVVIEMFEWLSADVAGTARANSTLRQMRVDYSALSDPVCLRDLAESGELAAEFEAVDDTALHPEFSP